MVRSYRDLLVWQKAIQLTLLIYRITKAFPREEIYGLTSQMRRCAVSIPSNIAEGAGRLNTSEYRNFLGIARGSSFELQTQLIIAKELGLAITAELEQADALCDEIGRMIYGTITTLSEK